MGRTTSFGKQALKMLICFCLVYTPFFANAGAAEKWEIVENVYDQSKNTVNVTAKKITQQAANSAVYKVQVPVNPGKLGSTIKMMLKGGVAVGAITALVEGVGWVIEDGQILKRKDIEVLPPDAEYYWPSYDKKFATATEAFNYWASKELYRVSITKTSVSLENSGNTAFFTYTYYTKPVLPDSKLQTDVAGFNRLKNPDYLPTYKPVLVPVSDQELGNETLGNGTEPASRTTPADDLITSAYSPNNPVSDAPAPQETNKALENANPQPEKEPEGSSETEKEKDPETGEETGKETTKFTWPNACDWFPAACDFFKVQKQDNKDLKENQKQDLAQNKTFFEKVSDWFDWTKEGPDQSDKNTELDIPDPQAPDINTDISFGGQCPAPRTMPVSFAGISTSIEFSFQWLCEIALIAKPVVISVSAFSAALIVAGIRGEDD